MNYEIAQIEVVSGSKQAFEQAVGEAAPAFKVAKGCRSLRIDRLFEHPSRYRLVVGWDSVKAPMIVFRQSEGFQRWRALAGPHFASSPQAQHVETVLSAF